MFEASETNMVSTSETNMKCYKQKKEIIIPRYVIQSKLITNNQRERIHK